MLPFSPDFQKSGGLIPAVVQDSTTDRVLMVGFMNEEALVKTYASKKVTFFSRSRQKLWTKGESSGNFLEFHSALLDCDKDTLLIKASPTGPVCHTGADTCFSEPNKTWNLHQLEVLIQDRIKNPKENSYTNKLLGSGINKIAQKVGEEAVELVIESKDSNKDLFLGEAADLMYHFLVLLAAKGQTLKEVEAVLEKRHNKN